MGINSDAFDYSLGFLPKNYIRSGALCQSGAAVSEKDTRLVPKNGENPLRIIYINFIKAEKCRKIGTFLMLSIFLVTSILRTQRASEA